MVLCNIPGISILSIFLHLLQNVQTDIQQAKIDKLACAFFIWIHDSRPHNKLFVRTLHEHEPRYLLRLSQRGSFNGILNSTFHFQNILPAHFTVLSF